LTNAPPPYVSRLKLLKASEVADLLGIAERTVWRYRSSGELPAPVSIGGATRWRLTDIQAFIDEQIGGGR